MMYICAYYPTFSRGLGFSPLLMVYICIFSRPLHNVTPLCTRFRLVQRPYRAKIIMSCLKIVENPRSTPPPIRFGAFGAFRVFQAFSSYMSYIGTSIYVVRWSVHPPRALGAFRAFSSQLRLCPMGSIDYPETWNFTKFML